MKVLVTGGAGYIGSILVPELLKAGHNVTVVDNFMYRQNSLLEHCYDKKFRIIRGDVRDTELIKQEVSSHDVIIPLAAIVGMPACKRNPKSNRKISFFFFQTLIQVMDKVKEQFSRRIMNSTQFQSMESPKLMLKKLYARLKIQLFFVWQLFSGYLPK